MLLKSDIEKSRKLEESAENISKPKILDLALVVSSSKIDAKKVDPRKFPGLELVEELDL